MQSLESARQKILEAVAPLGPELIPAQGAFLRILAEDIVAPIHLPSFDNSAMDGYAVRAADTAPAGPDATVELEIVAHVRAGSSESPPLHAGQCARIFTGAPLPSGADAVIMQEDVRLHASDPVRVFVGEPVKPWENVRFAGEDVKSGSTILKAGQRLTATRLGAIAALGISSLSVGRRPTIGLLATGSELVEPGQALGKGQIYESNRATLRPLIESCGAICRVFPLVPDSPEATETTLAKALAECDAVVSSGGVSVGELDFVRSAFEALGGRLEFWKVAIKPGKPFLFGQLNRRFLFGLPGNPVSALVTCFLLVRPALLRWQGAGSVEPPTSWGLLDEPLVNAGDRRHFVRVCLTSDGRVRSAGKQASHLLGSLSQADGLVDVPPNTTLTPGSAVRMLRLDL